MKKIILASIISLTSLTAYCQNCFSNSDVFYMHDSNVSKEIIIAKMDYSNCCFDVSPGALIDLKKKGVSDSIVKRMIYIDSQLKKRRPFTYRLNARTKSHRIPF